MARRGTSKWKSVEQEEYVATCYSGGKRSASSGAADTDAGDVRTANSLIECKTTGGPGTSATQTPRFIKWLEKVAKEAWEEGKDPALALRYYDPASPLADRDGYIDVVVRPLADDSVRDDWYASRHEDMERQRQAEADYLEQQKGPKYNTGWWWS